MISVLLRLSGHVQQNMFRYISACGVIQPINDILISVPCFIFKERSLAMNIAEQTLKLCGSVINTEN